MINYKSGQQDSIFDVATLKYGSLSGLAALIDDNEVIEPDGSARQFREEYAIRTGEYVAQNEVEKVNSSPNEQSTVIGDPLYLSGVNQSIFDVALTEYGGLQGLAFLLTDNPGLIQSGQVQQFRRMHQVRKNEFVNLKIKAAMLRLKPASEGKVSEGGWITDDGQSWITDDGQTWITE